MTGSRPWIGWRICWKYISPLALFLVLVATVYDLTEGTATYQAFVGCEQVFQYFSIHVLFNSPDVIVKISKYVKTRVEIKPWIKPRLNAMLTSIKRLLPLHFGKFLAENSSWSSCPLELDVNITISY